MWTTSGVTGFSRAPLLELLEPTPSSADLGSPHSDLLRSYEALRRRRTEDSLPSPASSAVSQGKPIASPLGYQRPIYTRPVTQGNAPASPGQHVIANAQQQQPAPRKAPFEPTPHSAATAASNKQPAGPVAKHSLRGTASTSGPVAAKPVPVPPTRPDRVPSSSTTNTQLSPSNNQHAQHPSRNAAGAGVAKPSHTQPTGPTTTKRPASSKPATTKPTATAVSSKANKRTKPAPVQLAVTGRAMTTTSPPRQESPLRSAHRTMQAKIAAMQETQHRLMTSGVPVPGHHQVIPITLPTHTAVQHTYSQAAASGAERQAAVTRLVTGFSSPASSAAAGSTGTPPLQSPSSRLQKLQRLKELRGAVRQPAVVSEASDLADLLHDADLSGPAPMQQQHKQHKQSQQQSQPEQRPSTGSSYQAHSSHTADEYAQLHDGERSVWAEDTTSTGDSSHLPWTQQQHTGYAGRTTWQHDTDTSDYLASRRVTEDSVMTTTTTATSTEATTLTDDTLQPQDTEPWLGAEASGMPSVDMDTAPGYAGRTQGQHGSQQRAAGSRRVAAVTDHTSHHRHRQHTDVLAAVQHVLATVPARPVDAHTAAVHAWHSHTAPAQLSHSPATTALQPQIIVIHSPSRVEGSVPKVSTAAQTDLGDQDTARSPGRSLADHTFSSPSRVGGQSVAAGSAPAAAAAEERNTEGPARAPGAPQAAAEEAEPSSRGTAGRGRRPMVAEMIRRFREEPPAPRSVRAHLAADATDPSSSCAPSTHAVGRTEEALPPRLTLEEPLVMDTAAGSRDTSPGLTGRLGAHQDDPAHATEVVAAALLARSRALLKERDAIQERIQTTLSKFSHTARIRPATSPPFTNKPATSSLLFSDSVPASSSVTRLSGTAHTTLSVVAQPTTAPIVPNTGFLGASKVSPDDHLHASASGGTVSLGSAVGQLPKRPVSPVSANQSWRQKLRVLLETAHNPPDPVHLPGSVPQQPLGSTASQVSLLAQPPPPLVQPFLSRTPASTPGHSGTATHTSSTSTSMPHLTETRTSSSFSGTPLLSYTAAFQRQLAATSMHTDSSSASVADTQTLSSSNAHASLTSTATANAAGGAVASALPVSGPTAAEPTSIQGIEAAPSAESASVAGLLGADEDLARILKKIADKFGYPDAPSLARVLTQEATHATQLQASAPPAAGRPGPTMTPPNGDHPAHTKGSDGSVAQGQQVGLCSARPVGEAPHPQAAGTGSTGALHPQPIPDPPQPPVLLATASPPSPTNPVQQADPHGEPRLSDDMTWAPMWASPQQSTSTTPSPATHPSLPHHTPDGLDAHHPHHQPRTQPPSPEMSAWELGVQPTSATHTPAAQGPSNNPQSPTPGQHQRIDRSSVSPISQPSFSVYLGAQSPEPCAAPAPRSDAHQASSAAADSACSCVPQERSTERQPGAHDLSSVAHAGASLPNERSDATRSDHNAHVLPEEEVLSEPGSPPAQPGGPHYNGCSPPAAARLPAGATSAAAGPELDAARPSTTPHRRSSSPRSDDGSESASGSGGALRVRPPSRSRSPTPSASPPRAAGSPAAYWPQHLRVNLWESPSPRTSHESDGSVVTATGVAHVLAQTVTCALFGDSPCSSPDWPRSGTPSRWASPPPPAPATSHSSATGVQPTTGKQSSPPHTAGEPGPPVGEPRQVSMLAGGSGSLAAPINAAGTSSGHGQAATDLQWLLPPHVTSPEDTEDGLYIWAGEHGAATRSQFAVVGLDMLPALPRLHIPHSHNPAPPPSASPTQPPVATKPQHTTADISALLADPSAQQSAPHEVVGAAESSTSTAGLNPAPDLLEDASWAYSADRTAGIVGGSEDEDMIDDVYTLPGTSVAALPSQASGLTGRDSETLHGGSVTTEDTLLLQELDALGAVQVLVVADAGQPPEAVSWLLDAMQQPQQPSCVITEVEDSSGRSSEGDVAGDDSSQVVPREQVSEDAEGSGMHCSERPQFGEHQDIDELLMQQAWDAADTTNSSRNDGDSPQPQEAVEEDTTSEGDLRTGVPELQQGRTYGAGTDAPGMSNSGDGMSHVQVTAATAKATVPTAYEMSPSQHEQNSALDGLLRQLESLASSVAAGSKPGSVNKVQSALAAIAAAVAELASPPASPSTCDGGSPQPLAGADAGRVVIDSQNLHGSEVAEGALSSAAVQLLANPGSADPAVTHLSTSADGEEAIGEVINPSLGAGRRASDAQSTASALGSTSAVGLTRRAATSPTASPQPSAPPAVLPPAACTAAVPPASAPQAPTTQPTSLEFPSPTPQPAFTPATAYSPTPGVASSLDSLRQHDDALLVQMLKNQIGALGARLRQLQDNLV